MVGVNYLFGSWSSRTTHDVETVAALYHWILFIEKEISTAEVSLLKKIIRDKLVENSNDVEVQRKDPNSPLYSVKSFEELKL